MLTQEITLAADGATFESMIKYEVFDQPGKLTETASAALGKATRLTF